MLSHGDFVFADTSEDRKGCGNCAYIDTSDEQYAGYHTLILKNKNLLIDSKYLAYQFLSEPWRFQIRSRVEGVKLYTISKILLGQCQILVPPQREQEQIVKYLDWKTSEINRLINGYQKQIKLLEEYLQKFIDQSITKGLNPSACPKNTRAEWMGSVPMGWQEMRVKDICREKNVRSVDGKEPHLSMSQRKGLVTDDDDTTRPFLSESYVGGKVCNENDLVLNRLKAHLGVFAIAPQLGVVSPDYTVLKINMNRIIPKYAEYLLKCNSCRKELTTRVRGITEGFWRLYTEDLYSIRICIPSIAEQSQILAAIKEKEDIVKSAVLMIQKEIELITEYKKTLISNVVTGQVDVQGVEIPEYEAVELPDTDSDVEVEVEG